MRDHPLLQGPMLTRQAWLGLSCAEPCCCRPAPQGAGVPGPPGAAHGSRGGRQRCAALPLRCAACQLAATCTHACRTAALMPYCPLSCFPAACMPATPPPPPAPARLPVTPPPLPARVSSPNAPVPADTDYGSTSRAAVLADSEALLTCYGVGEEYAAVLSHTVVEVGGGCCPACAQGGEGRAVLSQPHSKRGPCQTRLSPHQSCSRAAVHPLSLHPAVAALHCSCPSQARCGSCSPACCCSSRAPPSRATPALPRVPAAANGSSSSSSCGPAHRAAARLARCNPPHPHSDQQPATLAAGGQLRPAAWMSAAHRGRRLQRWSGRGPRQAACSSHAPAGATASR